MCRSTLNRFSRWRSESTTPALDHLLRVMYSEAVHMVHRTTYTNARANLATLCDKATDDREVIIITRRNSADVALVAAQELSSLLETAHLLRSPKNARRLLSAMSRAKTA